jgi:hypothetical protein
MHDIPRRRQEGGVVLVLALLLVLAGSLVGLAAMTTSDIEMMISGNQRSLQQVFDAAEAGVDVGINAFFIDAPPWGGVRPPIGDLSRPPWGGPASEDLGNGCSLTVWVTDMQVSKNPPPGYDPDTYRTFFYRIRSIGREQDRGSDVPAGVRETDQVVGVVYRIR